MSCKQIIVNRIIILEKMRKKHNIITNTILNLRNNKVNNCLYLSNNKVKDCW